MTNRMTSNLSKNRIVKCLLFSCVLLISACDGGIFGTGGADDADLIEGIDAGDNSGLTDGVSENDTQGTAGFDASNSSDTANMTGSPSESGTTTGSSTSGDTTGGTTGGETTGETTGDTTASAPITGGNVNDNEIEGFVNNTPTLGTPAARISLFNASTQTLNVIETGVNPETLLFEPADIVPGALSSTANLSNNITSLSIVDSENVTEALLTFSNIEVADSTLTNIVVRQNADTISVITLTTETTTSDPTLARVRMVQAGSLGDTDIISTMQLVSAGDNPGGIDLSFSPISFSDAQTDYLELPAGQYQLSDNANRIAEQVLSLSGGVVYTIVLTGDGDNTVVVINDTQMGER